MEPRKIYHIDIAGSVNPEIFDPVTPQQMISQGKSQCADVYTVRKIVIGAAAPDRNTSRGIIKCTEGANIPTHTEVRRAAI
jgi:hypothetical protein